MAYIQLDRKHINISYYSTKWWRERHNDAYIKDIWRICSETGSVCIISWPGQYFRSQGEGEGQRSLTLVLRMFAKRGTVTNYDHCVLKAMLKLKLSKTDRWLFGLTILQLYNSSQLSEPCSWLPQPVLPCPLQVTGNFPLLKQIHRRFFFCCKEFEHARLGSECGQF